LPCRVILAGSLLQTTELFTITYGAMVVQLLQDLKDVQLVNERLAQMYGVER
jgi:hypothetical protein